MNYLLLFISMIAPGANAQINDSPIDFLKSQCWQTEILNNTTGAKKTLVADFRQEGSVKLTVTCHFNELDGTQDVSVQVNAPVALTSNEVTYLQSAYKKESNGTRWCASTISKVTVPYKPLDETSIVLGSRKWTLSSTCY